MEFSGFYRLKLEERLEKVKKAAKLTDEEAKALLDSGALELDKADKTVENVIGAVHLPLGIATHFQINGKEMLIPMAVEEPSVIAAACRAAKQTLPEGFKAEADESIMIGQIQLTDLPDPARALDDISANKKQLLDHAAIAMKPHERYGCGVRDFDSKLLDTERGQMIIINFHIAVGDAQGANMVNTTLEHIAPSFEKLTA